MQCYQLKYMKVYEVHEDGWVHIVKFETANMGKYPKYTDAETALRLASFVYRSVTKNFDEIGLGIEVFSEKEAKKMLKQVRGNYCAKPGKTAEEPFSIDDAFGDTKTSHLLCYKMRVLDHLMDLGDLKPEPGDTPDTVKLAQCAKILKDKPSMFHELGRVLVVDFFLGNTDRITINGKATYTKSGKLFGYDDPTVDEYTVILQNPGNIFIVADNAFSLSWSVKRILGADPWDPNGAHLVFHKPIDNSDKFWNGIFLKDGYPHIRDELVKRIISAMNDAFDAQIQTKPLSSEHRKALHDGMHEARAALKDLLKKMIKKGQYQVDGQSYATPTGLQSRMALLGW